MSATRKVWIWYDVEGWAFDRIARLLAEELRAAGLDAQPVISKEWQATIPQFRANDVVVVLWWPSVRAWKLPPDVHLVSVLYDHASPDNWPAHFAEVMGKSDLIAVGNSILADLVGERCQRQAIMARDGVDCDLFCSNPTPHEGFLVGFCGHKTNTIKRFPLLEKGVALAQKTNPDIRLELRDFEGRIPHNEMPKWYNGVDCLINVSVAEGTPNPVLEACACGLPVICTPVGLVPYINAAGGKIRVLSPDPTPDEIAGQILALAGDKKRRKEGMANRAAVDVSCKIGYSELVAAMVDLPELKPIVLPPKPQPETKKRRDSVWTKHRQTGAAVDPTMTKADLLKAVETLRALVERLP
jgi:hypothetical protein